MGLIAQSCSAKGSVQERKARDHQTRAQKGSCKYNPNSATENPFQGSREALIVSQESSGSGRQIPFLGGLFITHRK